MICVPYCFLYGRDLIKMGYGKSDLLAVYALNLMLLPIQLGGVLMSLYQGVTGKKLPLGELPK
jgi:cellulose synthase (UDP-forming)